MTSLANQLKALTVPHTQSILGNDRKRVSLLFDQKEAANLDKEEVFAIGISGLEELIAIDPNFQEYEKSLFNETATNFERLVQTKEVNKALDDTIQTFLVHLSPYFQLRPAHKTLEWLMYRYHVHFYNMDTLFLCALPYHDSNIFTRLIQTLNLSDPKSRWHWVEPIQKHGTQLPCQTIATHILADPSFMNFVSSMPNLFIEIHGTGSTDLVSPVHSVVAFYTKTILTALEQAGIVREDFVAQLFPYIIKGLKSKNDEFKCSSYMIICLLCSKVAMDKHLLSSLLLILTKRIVSRLGLEAVSCVAYIFKTQDLGTLPRRCFKHLCRLNGIVQHICVLHNNGAMAAMWRPFLHLLVPAAVGHCRSAFATSSDGGRDVGDLTPGTPDYCAMLNSLLADCSLERELAVLIMKLLCESFVQNREICHTEDVLAQLSQQVRALVCVLEQRYRDVVDEEVKKQMQSSEHNASLVHEFALMSMASFKYQCSSEAPGDNLVLSVNHSLPSIRIHGIKMLVKMINAQQELPVDEEFVSSTFKARLLDDDKSVVDAVLTIGRHVLLRFLPAKEIVSIIASRLSEPSSKWASELVECCSLLKGSSTESMDIQQDITCLILTAASQGHVHIVQALSKSICDTSLLLKGITNVTAGAKEADVTQKIVECVAINLLELNQKQLAEMLREVCERQEATVSLMIGKALQSALLKMSSSAATRHLVITSLLKLCEELCAKDLIRNSMDDDDRSNLPDTKRIYGLVNEVGKMFREWPGQWTTSELGVTSYVRHFKLLVTMRHVPLLVQEIVNWRDRSMVDSAFVAVASAGDDLVTCNLLHLLHRFLTDGALKGLNLMEDQHQVVECLISLLASDAQLIRKASLKALSLILAKASVKDSSLAPLIRRILSLTKEISQDSLQISELCRVFFMDKSVSVVLARLLLAISTSITPVNMAVGLLRVLSFCDDLAVLKGIKDLLSRVLQAEPPCPELLDLCLTRYNQSTAPYMAMNADVWTLLVEALSNPTSAAQAIPLITKAFFAALDNLSLQQEVIRILLSVCVASQSAHLHSLITKTFRQICLSGEMLKPELEAPVVQKQESVQQSVKTKKLQRATTASSTNVTLESSPWRRVRILLELLQNKKKLVNVQLIIPTLFSLISIVLEMGEEAGTEYMKHLLLGCLENLLTRLALQFETRKDILTEEQLDMEAIVQCIRTSNNSQTHQQAMLLLSTAAKMFPDAVLHHVMTIFTFMGASIMRQDDMYSFQIISKTLDTVVPEIVKASQAAAEYTISGIIRVFVDAYPHIPEHRRLPLFSKLLHAVGEDRYLFACTGLFIESAVTSGPVNAAVEEQTKDMSGSGEVAFLLSLFAEFGIEAQLSACAQLLAYMCHLPVCNQEEATVSANRKKGKKLQPRLPEKSTISEALFDPSVRTAKQLRHFKYECAGFIVTLTSSEAFIDAVVNHTQDTELTTKFNDLIESGLKYVSHVAQEADRSAALPSAKFWRALLNKTYDILDKVNCLLPASVFISVVSNLMQHELPLIRRKAMDLLNNRLPQTAFDLQEISALIKLAERLKSIAFNSTLQDEEEDMTNRQTALYSLKLLTRHIANGNQKFFLNLVPEVCASLSDTLGSPVRANLLLLLGELVLQLSVNVVPHLPAILPKVLSVLQDKAILSGNDLLWVSALTSLQKIVETTPNFLSPYLQTILVIITTHSSMKEEEQVKGYRSQLPIRLKSLREALANKFPARVLVPVMIKSYAQIKDRATCVQSLMSVAAEHVKSISKEDLAAQHHKLLELLLLALDYRSEHSQCDPADIVETEDSVIRAAISMVVKLSESTFRPMYFKLFGWATRESESSERLISFYRLSICIGDTLKSLFSLFAGHFVKNAADTLSALSGTKSDLPDPFSSDKPDRAVIKRRFLAEAIVDTLFRVFLHDLDGFVSKQRFDMLMTPLVDQLENTSKNYESFISEHVVPCLSQLAIAAGDDSLWKPLIYQICLKTRHQDPKVRMSSLRALRSMNSKLGEDFMPLLPETIPFLAELMEDEEEDVELFCQEVIADMEKILGEPLQKYF